MNDNYLHRLSVNGKEFFTSARDRGDGTPITPVEVLNTTMVASDPFSGSSSMIKTFNKVMSGFVIMNDGANQLDFTINGQTFIVKPAESFQETFEGFTEIDINASSEFRAYCKRLINGESAGPPPIVIETIDVPTGLTVSGGDAYAYLNWDDNSQSIFSSYKVYQSSDGGLNYSEIANSLMSSLFNALSLTNDITYYFTVSAVDIDGNESEKSNVVSVTPTSAAVNTNVSGVSLSFPTASIQTDQFLKLDATILPTTALDKTVTWSSSDINIATVDNTGLIKGVSNGSVIITATTNDGGFSDSCNLTVTIAIQGFDYNNLIAYPDTSKIQMDQVVTIGPTGDNGAGDWVHPSILYFAEGWNGHQWWMGISPYPNTQGHYENTYFFYSDNGDNWVTPTGVTGTIFPLQSGFGNNSDPNLFMDLDGTTMHILNRAVYSDTTKPASTGSTASIIELISTTDGVTFTGRQTIIDTADTGFDIVAPSVVTYNGKYYLFAIDTFDQLHLTVFESDLPVGPWTEINRIDNGTLGDLWHPEVRYINGEFIVIANDGAAQGGSLMLGKFQTPMDTIIEGRSNYFANAVGTGNSRCYKSSLVYKSENDIELFMGTKGGTLDANCEWWVNRIQCERLQQTLDLSGYTNTQTIASMDSNAVGYKYVAAQYNKYAIQYTIDDIDDALYAFGNVYVTPQNAQLYVNGQTLFTRLWGISDGAGGKQTIGPDFNGFGIKVGDQITMIMTDTGFGTGDIEMYINGYLVKKYTDVYHLFDLGAKYFGPPAGAVNNVNVYLLPKFIETQQKKDDFDTQVINDYSANPSNFIVYDQFNRTDGVLGATSDNGVTYELVGTADVSGNKVDIHSGGSKILIPYTGNIQFIFKTPEDGLFNAYIHYEDESNYIKLVYDDFHNYSFETCIAGTVSKSTLTIFKSGTNSIIRFDYIDGVINIYLDTIFSGTISVNNQGFANKVGIGGFYQHTYYDYLAVKQL